MVESEKKGYIAYTPILSIRPQIKHSLLSVFLMGCPNPKDIPDDTSGTTTDYTTTKSNPSTSSTDSSTSSTDTIGTESTPWETTTWDTTTSTGTTGGNSCDSTPINEVPECDPSDSIICNGHGHCGQCDYQCHCQPGYVMEQETEEPCNACDSENGYENISEEPGYVFCMIPKPPSPDISRAPEPGDLYYVYGENLGVTGNYGGKVDTIEGRLGNGDWFEEVITEPYKWESVATIPDDKIDEEIIYCVRAKYFGIVSEQVCLIVFRLM